MIASKAIGIELLHPGFGLMEFNKRDGDIIFTSDGLLRENCAVEVNDIVTLKTDDEVLMVKVSSIEADAYAGGVGGSGVRVGALEDDSVCFFYDNIYACHKTKSG